MKILSEMIRPVFKWIKAMSTLRKVVTGLALLFIIYHLISFNYRDFSWSENSGHYLGLSAMIFVIISMIFSEINERRQNSKV